MKDIVQPSSMMEHGSDGLDERSREREKEGEGEERKRERGRERGRERETTA